VYAAFDPDQLHRESCYEVQLVPDLTPVHGEILLPDIWANVFYLQLPGDRGNNPPEIKS
jgi:hypothetical protein